MSKKVWRLWCFTILYNIWSGHVCVLGNVDDYPL